MSNFRGRILENGDVNWTFSPQIRWILNEDTVQGGQSNYFGGISSFGEIGWINCDKFATSGNRNVVRVKLDTGFDASNAQVYFFFHNTYAVAPAQPNATCECFKSYDTGLPIDQLVTFIAISKKEDKYYGEISEPTYIEPDHIETLVLEQTSMAVFTAEVQALD